MFHIQEDRLSIDVWSRSSPMREGVTIWDVFVIKGSKYLFYKKIYTYWHYTIALITPNWTVWNMQWKKSTLDNDGYFNSLNEEGSRWYMLASHLRWTCFWRPLLSLTVPLPYETTYSDIDKKRFNGVRRRHGCILRLEIITFLLPLSGFAWSMKHEINIIRILFHRMSAVFITNRIRIYGTTVSLMYWYT